MIAKRLNRAKLVSIVESIFAPAGKGLSSDEMDRDLLVFCLNCPDPASAMDLVVEAPRGATSMEVVDHALAMPTRSVDTWSEADLAKDHPLRHWKLEE